MRHGLLIDFEYCCDCHTCEVACQKEHGYDVGQFGLHVLVDGPWNIKGTKKKQYAAIPVPTALCDLCGKRVGEGKLPACVSVCMTRCMKYGPIDELLVDMSKKGKQVMFVP